MEASVEGQESLSTPSSTRYSCAGGNPLFVDSFADPEQPRNHSASQPENSEGQLEQRIRSFLSPLARSIRDSNRGRSDDLPSGNALGIEIRRTNRVEEESSEGYIIFLALCDHELRTSPPILIDQNKIDLAIMEATIKHQDMVDRIAAGFVRPLVASELGLLSAFRSTGSLLFHERTGVKPANYRVWTEGFNPSVFSRSARLFGGDSKPVLVKYTVSGSERKYADFYLSSSVYFRNRSMIEQLLAASPIDPNMASAPPAPDFGRLAERFFSGQSVDEDFEELNVNTNQSEMNTGGPSSGNIYHVVKYQKSAWVQFVEEVVAAASVESVGAHRQIQPFANTAHKSFGLFMQDVIMANEMEQCVKLRNPWHSLRIYRGDAQVKALDLLDDPENLTPEAMAAIAQIKEPDDMFLGQSLDESVVDDLWLNSDNSDAEREEKLLLEEARARDAAAQLIAENEAEESKKEASKKKKPTSRKARPSRTPIKNLFQEGQTGNESGGVVEKNESPSIFNNQRVTGQREDVELDDALALKPSQLRGKNDQLKAHDELDTAGASRPLSGNSIVTFADYENAPRQSDQSIDDDEGWQTVKPKQQRFASASFAKGNPRSAQGSEMGSRNFSSQTASSNTPGNAPASSGEKKIDVQDKSDKQFGAKSTGRKPSRTHQKKATPGNSSSSKPSEQADFDSPKVYEEEFPAMPSKVTMPSVSKQTVTVSAASRQASWSSLASKNQKTAQKSPSKSENDDALIPKSASDPTTTTSEIAVAPVPTPQTVESESEVLTVEIPGPVCTNGEEPVDSNEDPKEIETVQASNGEESVNSNEDPKGIIEIVQAPKDEEGQVSQISHHQVNEDHILNESTTEKDIGNSEDHKGTEMAQPPRDDGVEVQASQIARDQVNDGHVLNESTDEKAISNGNLTNVVTVQAPTDNEVQVSQIAHDQVNEDHGLNESTAEKDIGNRDLTNLATNGNSEVETNENDTDSTSSEVTEIILVAPAEKSSDRVINEAEPGDQVQESTLDWAADTIMERRRYDENRPRSSSTPPEWQFDEDDPALIRQRPRSESANAWITEENQIEGIPTISHEENEEDPVATPGAAEGATHEQPENDKPAGNGEPPETLIVVTMHPDHTFTMSPPVVGSAPTTHVSDPAVNQGHATSAPVYNATPSSGLASNQGYNGGLVINHPFPHSSNSGRVTPDMQGAAYTYQISGNAPPEYRHFPPSSAGVNPFANPLTWRPRSLYGVRLQQYKIVKSIEEDEGVSQAGTSSSIIGPQQQYPCTQCAQIIVPTMEKPMVLCPGCGPQSTFKYCSVACLLVDAWDHAGWCINYPASARTHPHCFAPDSPYIYEINPIVAEDRKSGSREKFRQRAFVLYCRYGQFPKVAEAWCRSHPYYRWPQQLQAWDLIKYTGVYHIFSSGLFEPTDRGNPTADVIYTVNFPQGDPRKGILSRAINALFIRDEGMRKPIAAFAYRMIRSILLTPGLQIPTQDPFELVIMEFERQFMLEFGFDRTMDTMAHYRFDFAVEARMMLPYLLHTETEFQILRYWARDSF